MALRDVFTAANMMITQWGEVSQPDHIMSPNGPKKCNCHSNDVSRFSRGQLSALGQWLQALLRGNGIGKVEYVKA